MATRHKGVELKTGTHVLERHQLPMGPSLDSELSTPAIGGAELDVSEKSNLAIVFSTDNVK